MKGRVQWVVLSALITTCCNAPEVRVKLPCDLDGVRLGMSEADLVKARPMATLDRDYDVYTESIDGCGSLASRAMYVLTRKHIRRIRIERSVSIKDAMVTEQSVARNFEECKRLWGPPVDVGVFRMSLGREEEYFRVVVIWRSNDVQILLVYTPVEMIREAERHANYAAALGNEIVVSAGDEAAEDLRILDVDRDGELVTRYYPPELSSR